MVFTLRAAKQLDPKRYSEALNFIHLKSLIFSDLGASGMFFFFYTSDVEVCLVVWENPSDVRNNSQI